MPEKAQDRRLHQTITLRDGRRLGYAEYGDPQGMPLLFFHGTPGSRLMAVPEWDDTSLGIRLIAPDRPGYGSSDYKRDRTLLDWTSDVAELADALTLERFVIAGVSGGGPHSLACAYKLNGRVIRAGVISGATPIDSPAALEGMHSANKIAFTLARRAPVVLRALFAVQGFLMKRFPDASLRSLEKQLPEADRAIMDDPELRVAMRKESAESIRQGSRVVADEALMFLQPWGFAFEDITVPVLLWHGAQDKNAPVRMAQEMERRIPNCTATYYPDEGHLYFMRRWPEIARALKGER